MKVSDFFEGEILQRMIPGLMALLMFPFGAVTPLLVGLSSGN